MIRESLVILLVLAFLARIDGLPRRNIRSERRLRRQASRIPYASLSTGAIPSRLRNRLRGRRPSSPSSGSNGGSSTSTSSRGSTSGSTRGYGSSGGYQQGRQGGNSEDGVPMGHSTYPFGVSQYTNSRNLQTPYSDQTPPGTGTSYRGQSVNSYQPTYGQPTNQFQPYGYGATGGYGAVSPYGGGYGANPYMYGGVMPQVPYMNPYPWGQGGYAGAGYMPTGSYGGASGRAAIGSPYRDPNSRFTSWVHPQGETSNPYTGGTSYGRGGSSGGSYYGSSYGGSSSRYVSSNGEEGYSQTNPYGSSSSRGGFSSSNPYDSSSSSLSRYPSSGTSYPGGSSSSSTTNYRGGGQSASAGSEGAYPSVGSYGYGDRTSEGYNPQSPGDYGSDSDQFGSSNPYGSSDIYGGSYGAGENPYSQESGSRYESTSGSRYDSFGRSRQRGQASQSYRGSQSRAGQSSGRQSSRFYMGESSSPSASDPYSSSTYYSRYGSSGATSNSRGSSRQPSRTSGRFFNPDSGQQVSSQDTVSPSSYQRGRFYNPQEVVANAQGADPSNPVQASQDDSIVGQQVRPSARGESGAVPPRENYYSQQGTFLVARPDVPETGRQNETNVLHPSQKKCQKLDDGLPDLYLDYKRMRASVRLDRIPLSNLTCAMSEGADCLSASAYGNNRITLRRLLRFNTIAHNIGTAVFLPNLHRDDWIFHSCHHHWHSMKEFAHFHLFNSSGALVGEGHKVSFCLQDSECNNPCPKSYDCKRNTQGISPGCRDVYEASYDCQWVDVTDVPSGEYTLRVTVNPVVGDARAVPELSYTNNVVECKVEITVTEAEAYKCFPA